MNANGHGQIYIWRYNYECIIIVVIIIIIIIISSSSSSMCDMEWGYLTTRTGFRLSRRSYSSLCHDS